MPSTGQIGVQRKERGGEGERHGNLASSAHKRKNCKHVPLCRCGIVVEALDADMTPTMLSDHLVLKVCGAFASGSHLVCSGGLTMKSMLAKQPSKRKKEPSCGIGAL